MRGKVEQGKWGARWALAGLCLLLAVPGCAKQRAGEREPLLCYVGGTMRPAMEELAALYEKETGRPVQLDYGDSGQLMIRIEAARRGDLYVCHDPFLNALMKKGLGDKGWTVATLTPTIAVAKGNPKNIKGLKDLAREGIKLGLTDAQYSTAGHIAPVMFDKAKLRKEIEANVVTRSRMGGEIANAVSIGSIDAGIVWNAVIFARKDKLDGVAIEPEYHPDPKVDAVTTATFGQIDMSNVKVTIATLACSRQLEAARAFAEFVHSPKGQAVFAACGFSPANEEEETGAPAAPAKPQTAPAADSHPGKSLLLYCGAGIRPPVDEIVNAYSAQSGVTVECDYAGSGVLLSRIKLAKTGDLFMPGETDYIEAARKESLVGPGKAVCYLVPVILVKKGNPKGIHGLQDLLRPGVRLGLGNPDACVIGKLSEKIFEKNKIPLDAIKKNQVFSSLTVNEMGIQIKTGQLDAAIVWEATAAEYADAADAIAIPPDRNLFSQVAIGVLESAKDKPLAEEFIAFLAGEKGRAIFAKHRYALTCPAEGRVPG